MPRTALIPPEAPPKKPNGRPPGSGLYREEMDELAERVVGATGADLAQLAKVLGVGARTVTRWLEPITGLESFRLSVKRGRDTWDVNNNEKNLHKLAEGWEYDEVTTEEIILKHGSGENAIDVPAIRKRITHKIVPPNLGAVIFHLTNRNRERWQNTQRQVVEGTVKHDHKHNHSLVLDLTAQPIDVLEHIRQVAVEAERSGKPLKLIDAKQLERRKAG